MWRSAYSPRKAASRWPWPAESFVGRNSFGRFSTIKSRPSSRRPAFFPRSSIRRKAHWPSREKHKRGRLDNPQRRGEMASEESVGAKRALERGETQDSAPVARPAVAESAQDVPLSEDSVLSLLKRPDVALETVE